MFSFNRNHKSLAHNDVLLNLPREWACLSSRWVKARGKVSIRMRRMLEIKEKCILP